MAKVGTVVCIWNDLGQYRWFLHWTIE